MKIETCPEERDDETQVCYKTRWWWGDFEGEEGSNYWKGERPRVEEWKAELVSRIESALHN